MAVNSTRRLWELLEPLHAITYFAPESIGALSAAGYRGYWMSYFASRAAPLGPVGPEVVRALFYNFSPERVTGALPDAWNFAPPAAALEARLSGTTEALRRILGDADVSRVADLSLRAALSAPIEGRPLGGANQALPVPEDPLGRLWHAATILREHRGDGHVAALLTAGILGRDSHVFHSLAVGMPPATYTVARDFSEDEWQGRLEGLMARGLASAEGLTPEGAALKAQIEDTTDRLAATAFEVLSADEIDELLAGLKPLTRAVIDAGNIPLDMPVGLDLRNIA